MERQSKMESLLATKDLKTPIYCYKDISYHYRVHIICCGCKPHEAYSTSQILTNSIAFNIQGNLDNTIERYNIYLLIFSPGITSDERIEIEEDKYCCRKIVIPENIPETDNKREQKIKDRLFNFIIPNQTELSQYSLTEILTNWNQDLYGLVNQLKNQISASTVEKAVNLLEQENNDV